jgi:hypothetical protein
LGKCTSSYLLIVVFNCHLGQLEAEKSKREETIQNLYDDLYVLWSKLGVSDEEADAFVERWKGVEEASVEAVSLLVSNDTRPLFPIVLKDPNGSISENMRGCWPSRLRTWPFSYPKRERI